MGVPIYCVFNKAIVNNWKLLHYSKQERSKSTWFALNFEWHLSFYHFLCVNVWILIWWWIFLYILLADTEKTNFLFQDKLFIADKCLKCSCMLVCGAARTSPSKMVPFFPIYNLTGLVGIAKECILLLIIMLLC